ncbi:hypothetical protein [Terriglobus sp. RCC_193]|uniref:hypothetical protein n=1 Tax=Terriglobus sp. RCC_193 TaxID=3239218 RepID=UPI003526603E
MSADPITAMTVLGTAAKIPGIVSSTLSSLKTVREMTKESKDTGLKDQLSDVYNSVLELREALHDLQTENESLRKALELKSNIGRRGEFGYFFQGDETDPLCPVCYQRDSKAVYLEKPVSGNGYVSRKCAVCGYFNQEREGTPVIRRPAY